jgi:hypothetical protein
MASSVELKEEREWSVGENGHQEKAPEGMQGFICQGELGLPAGRCRPGVMHVMSGARFRARPCAKRRRVCMCTRERACRSWHLEQSLALAERGRGVAYGGPRQH